MKLFKTARNLLKYSCNFHVQSVVTVKKVTILDRYYILRPQVNPLFNYSDFKNSSSFLSGFVRKNLRFSTTSLNFIQNYSVDMDESLSKESIDVKVEESSLDKSPIKREETPEPMEESIEDSGPSNEQKRSDQHDPEASDIDNRYKDVPKGMSKRAFKRMERRKKWEENQRRIKLEALVKNSASGDDITEKTKLIEGEVIIKSKNMSKREKRRDLMKDKISKEKMTKLTQQEAVELKNLPIKSTNCLVTREEEGDKVFHHRENGDGVREYLLRNWSDSSDPKYFFWKPNAQLPELEQVVVDYDKNAPEDQVDSEEETDDQKKIPQFRQLREEMNKRNAELLNTGQIGERWIIKEMYLEKVKDAEFNHGFRREAYKRKADDDFIDSQDIKKTHMIRPGYHTDEAKMETKALKAKRPGFSEERYNETSYYIENGDTTSGLRKVYPYYFTFTTFTKGRWVGEKILDVFAKEFRAHPAEEYERCIKSGTLTVNYEKVDTDYRLKHNDLLANIVHRHEVPVTAEQIPIVHVDEDLVVVDKPASIPVHPCGRYRHNTVVFILAKEYNLKNLRTIHRLDRLTSGLLLFGRTPKKAREMEQQIRTRQVSKEYVCRVEGEFPREHIECNEPIEVVSYKIGVCKVAPTGKDCRTEFQRLSFNGTTSVVLCRPHTGRMHQIRVHLQYLGYPIVNDPLYNHIVFGPNKGKGGVITKTDDQLIQDLIKIHNAENWLGMDGDAEYSMFKATTDKAGEEEGGSQRNTPSPKEKSPSVEVGPRIVTPPSLTSTGMIIPTSAEIAHTNKTFNGCNSGRLATPGGVVAVTGIGGPVGDHGKTSPGGDNAQKNEYTYQPSFMTVDHHCYECKVRYRDPKPRDLVMYLHALKYSGPGWHFETKLPEWAAEEWKDQEEAVV